MTLNEFGRFLQTKSVGRLDAPINEQMTERVYSAMKKIANDTTPIRWVEYSAEGINVFRRVDAETYLRYPNKPILDSGDQLDIEEALVDALALYVMAGLEVQRAKINMGMYYNEIERYNENLMQMYLQEASHDARRYYQFP